jgi:hypothetical protein
VVSLWFVTDCYALGARLPEPPYRLPAPPAGPAAAAEGADGARAPAQAGPHKLISLQAAPQRIQYGESLVPARAACSKLTPRPAVQLSPLSTQNY